MDVSSGIIEVPERPLQLLVSGRMLYILTHHAVYRAEITFNATTS